MFCKYQISKNTMLVKKSYEKVILKKFCEYTPSSLTVFTCQMGRCVAIQNLLSSCCSYSVTVTVIVKYCYEILNSEIKIFHVTVFTTLYCILSNPLSETTVYFQSVYYNDAVPKNHRSIYLN